MFKSLKSALVKLTPGEEWRGRLPFNMPCGECEEDGDDCADNARDRSALTDKGGAGAKALLEEEMEEAPAVGGAVRPSELSGSWS